MTSTEYKRRRKQLMRMMGANSIAIIPSAPIATRNRDVDYRYRPDSDFYYLTGFDEPEAVAVLIPGRSHAEYILFCRERDKKKEMWDGARAGQEGACEIHGADDSFPIGDLNDILPRMLEQRERVFYAMGSNPELDKHLGEWVNDIRNHSRSGVHGPIEFIALDHYLHDMRLYKNRAEIKAMRSAARITAKAHRRAMQVCRPGMMEFQLEAEINHEFAMNGARHEAYPSIVGGGNNACVLHYIENSAELQDGDLVLIDAGCEFDYYAADITRTFPVNGRFSEAQRELYEAVLEAQETAIKATKPGNHWNDPHEAAIRSITKSLVHLGILKGSVSKLIKDKAYEKYYVHRTGHWLGLDVHDVGDYKIDGEWRLLEAGMTLTIEPGVYIPKGTRGVNARWRGMGIRIEDDVLVTKDGHDILSKDAPKAVDEIEAIMNA